MTRLGGRFSAIALALALCASHGAWADVTVTLRGGLGTVSGASAIGDAGGLDLRGERRLLGDEDALAPFRTGLLPWDMVREIRGETVGLGEFLEIGEDLWRARIRIERGDGQLAAPLLAKHWARFRDAEGPTAALVAEGSLRVALENGDIRAAAEPWLACLRHRADGIGTRFPGMRAAYDPDNGLLPALSPFMPASRRGDLVAACESARASGDAAEVARLIAHIARGGVEPPAAAGGDSEETGRLRDTELRKLSPEVRALTLLDAIAGAADTRALDRAVQAFDRMFDEAPSYLSAWRLAAIGTSRARLARAETEGAARRRALSRAALDLLAVPASGLDHHGFVDAYALEEASALMRESGDEPAAAQLAALAADRLRQTT
jgi:hypothetical protein